MIISGILLSSIILWWVLRRYLLYVLNSIENDQEAEKNSIFMKTLLGKRFLEFLQKYFMLLAVLIVLVVNYPILESINGNLFWQLIISITIMSLLIIAAISDLKSHLILDSNLIMLVLGKLSLLYIGGRLTWYSGLFIPLLCASVLFLIWYFTAGKGIGFADVKLFFVLTMGLTLKSIFLATYMALLLASLLVVLIYWKKLHKSYPTIPFGPFLILGFMLLG